MPESSNTPKKQQAYSSGSSSGDNCSSEDSEDEDGGADGDGEAEEKEDALHETKKVSYDLGDGRHKSSERSSKYGPELVSLSDGPRRAC